MPRRLGRASLIVSLALMSALPEPSPGADSKWIRLRTTNFEMYSSASPRGARSRIQEFEQVREFFLQAFGAPPAKPLPVRLVVFGSEKEYEPYRFNDYAVAYYQATPRLDYIVMGRSGADAFPIAVHEYAHLLIKHEEMKLPPWLNEGLAELYSTLRPIGDKVLIGDIIPGRRQALLSQKWVPLAAIMAARDDSPFYNEKDKAGSLYNEGWALTHMLCFHADYRAKFGELVHSISGGEDSAQALVKVYGRSLAEIEKHLQQYMRGSSFQGAIVPAKLSKVSGEIPAEPLDDFDTELMFADLIYRPGREAEAQAAFERLAQREPKRPEPQRELGYLAWKRGQFEKAIELFGKAYENGARDRRLLWDYGRLIESNHGEDAVRILSDLLSQDPERTEVRLELAEVQLLSGQPKAAIRTLDPIRKVTPEDAPRYFRIAVMAHLRNGDPAAASGAAQRFSDVAITDEARAAAEKLMSLAAARSRSAEPEPPERPEPPEQAAAPEPPTPRQTMETSAPDSEPKPQAPELLSISGRFVELDCRGPEALMIVETARGRSKFLIDDPANVGTPTGAAFVMSCGPQKTPLKIKVSYERPQGRRAGIQGLVRKLVF